MPYALQVLYNLLAAPIFVLVVGLVPEPWRQRSMVAFLGAAALVYLDGGLGVLELPFAVALAACAVVGWRKYPSLGVGWLLHTASDVVHHTLGMPMVASMPLSSFGCAVFDPLIAIWFFAGAPSTQTMLLRLRGLFRSSAVRR
jgi:hypothetical protein